MIPPLGTISTPLTHAEEMLIAKVTQSCCAILPSGLAVRIFSMLVAFCNFCPRQPRTVQTPLPTTRTRSDRTMVSRTDCSHCPGKYTSLSHDATQLGKKEDNTDGDARREDQDATKPGLELSSSYKDIYAMATTKRGTGVVRILSGSRFFQRTRESIYYV